MMSNFKIVHEIDGRLRVRFGQYAFTNEQATILKSDFLKLEYVRYVEAHYKNGRLLLVYDENYKNEVFGYLKSYDLSTLQNREIPENCSQNLQVLDQSFKHELIKIFAKRYAVKLFLPNVVGKGIAIYKALAYFKAGIASLGNKRIDVPVLDATSIGVSLLRKEFNTASNIMLMLKISELLEDYTRQKVTLQLGDSLMNKFDKVWIYKDGQEQEIAMSDLKQGQTVIVQTGSMVPIDGEIIDGEAMVNESSFTGEPLSKRVTLNDTVYAGTLIEEGKIFVKVRNLQDESRIAKIIDMIDTNESLKASIQSKAEHMADAIVPYSFLGFFGVWAFTRNLTRATALLLVDYSCAIRLSTSISVISAMQEASMHNVLVKGGKHLESMKDANVIVFDKTGTLTKGEFEVVETSNDDLLEIGAYGEYMSNHPIARSIVKAYGKEIDSSRIEDFKEIAGKGLTVVIDHQHYYLGNEKYFKELNLSVLQPENIGTMVHIACGDQYLGYIVVADVIKESTIPGIQDLKKAHVKQTVMLTGDHSTVANDIATRTGIDQVYSDLLPQDKVSQLENLMSDEHVVAFVGDGINDAPVLARSDIGIAMGGVGSDVAIEAADVVLMSDDITAIAKAIDVSHYTDFILKENVTFTLIIKIGVLILTLFGLTNMWMGVFADVGVTLIAICNSMRILYKKS